MAKRFGARFSLQDGRHRAAGGDGIQALDRSHHVLEASVNTWAVADLLRQHAGRVVVSNPLRTRAIASAKVKTDKVDSEVLAQLLAADFIPEVWVPDDATRQLRHLVSRRRSLVQQQTRQRNRIHAVLHRNLVDCPATDLFGVAGAGGSPRFNCPPTNGARSTATSACWRCWRTRSEALTTRSLWSWSTTSVCVAYSPSPAWAWPRPRRSSR